MIDDNTLNEKSVRLIKLADGTLIDPQTREPIRAGLQPEKNRPAPEPEEAEEAEDIKLNVVATERRSIMDLTLNKQQMALVNNVLVYTIWGLPVDEIAIQCSCSERDVLMVRDLDEYKRMYDAMIDGVRNAFADTVHGIFANAAPIAARKMVKKMKDKSGDISLAAVKDVLDRSGHRPVDRVEHTHNIGQGELRIRVVKATDIDSMPTINLERTDA